MKDEKYSLSPFDEYKTRVSVEYTGTLGKAIKVDVYTTRENKEMVLEELNQKTNHVYEDLEIVNWATKEDDDRDAKMIKEMCW